jgi:hypothetical protein
VLRQRFEHGLPAAFRRRYDIRGHYGHDTSSEILNFGDAGREGEDDTKQNDRDQPADDSTSP